MHAELNVRFTISIDEAKTIPLATVAEFVTEQNVESILVESVVECLDAARVEALCSQKHAQTLDRFATRSKNHITLTTDWSGCLLW